MNAQFLELDQLVCTIWLVSGEQAFQGASSCTARIYGSRLTENSLFIIKPCQNQISIDSCQVRGKSWNWSNKLQKDFLPVLRKIRFM